MKINYKVILIVFLLILSVITITHILNKKNICENFVITNYTDFLAIRTHCIYFTYLKFKI